MHKCPLIWALAAALVVSGCSGLSPLKPGKAKNSKRTTISSNGTTNQVTTTEDHELTQPENPEQSTQQTTEKTSKSTLPIPAGSKLTEHVTRHDASSGQPVTTTTILETSEPTTKTEEVTEKNAVVIGGAQKDTSRELAVKFQNMKPVQFIGIGLILVAGAFAYFKWWTPAALSGGTGVAMIVMSHAIVGNERIILILAGLAAVIFAVFRAYDKGQLDRVLPDSLDKNKPSNTEIHNHIVNP